MKLCRACGQVSDPFDCDPGCPHCGGDVDPCVEVPCVDPELASLRAENKRLRAENERLKLSVDAHIAKRVEAMKEQDVLLEESVRHAVYRAAVRELLNLISETCEQDEIRYAADKVRGLE